MDLGSDYSNEIMYNKISTAILMCIILFGCYHPLRPYESLPVDAPPDIHGDKGVALPFALVAIIGEITDVASAAPICTGIVVDSDRKQPIQGACVMIRVPQISKMVIVNTPKDGSFNVDLKKRWAGSREIQITALAKMHGRGVIIGGRGSCRNLVLELPRLSEREWHAYRDEYIQPVVKSSIVPMWDVDSQSQEELKSFTRILY